jgi:hypothetical protein
MYRRRVARRSHLDAAFMTSLDKFLTQSYHFLIVSGYPPVSALSMIGIVMRPKTSETKE